MAGFCADPTGLSPANVAVVCCCFLLVLRGWQTLILTAVVLGYLSWCGAVSRGFVTAFVVAYAVLWYAVGPLATVAKASVFVCLLWGLGKVSRVAALGFVVACAAVWLLRGGFQDCVLLLQLSVLAYVVCLLKAVPTAAVVACFLLVVLVKF